MVLGKSMCTIRSGEDQIIGKEMHVQAYCNLEFNNTHEFLD
jgi:hypothetical protein